MDLNLGGLVRQTTAPVLDAPSLVRAAGVDQIASFLRDNPDQRGVIETALATGGRAGDLSAIVERAGIATGQAVDVIRDTVGAAAQSVQAADGGTVTRVVTAAVNVVGRAGDVVGQTLGRVTGTIADVPARTAQAVGGETVSRGATVAANVVGRAGEAAGQTLGRVNGASGEVALRSAQTTGATVGRSLGGTAEALTGPVQRGETLARLSGDSARSTLSNGLRSASGIFRGPDGASALDAAARSGSSADTGPTTRLGGTLAAAIREGRVAELVTVAAKEGRLAALVSDARATGQMPALVAASRTLDGVLAAFVAKGGLSATELALFARAGLLSSTDVQALRDAGVPVDVEDPATFQPAPRDGPAEQRFDTDGVPIEGSVAEGTADPALARFDWGAIRIASRSAVETYGALGPPDGMIVAADAFEALLRAADRDLAVVERQLGLDAGVLSDPDTLIAFVERRDLAGLRLPPDGLGAAAASWLPGGDRAGGLPAALASLGRGTPYREMTLAGTVK